MFRGPRTGSNGSCSCRVEARQSEACARGQHEQSPELGARPGPARDLGELETAAERTEAAPLFTFSFPLQPPGTLLAGVCVHLVLSRSSSTPHSASAHTTWWRRSCQGPQRQPVASPAVICRSHFPPQPPPLLCFPARWALPASPSLAPSPVPPLDVACGWSWTYFSSTHSH